MNIKSDTILDRSTKEKALATELKNVLEIIKKNINTKAVILYGGYGRGEGAWFKKGQGFYPYNDFDLLLIVNDDEERKCDLKALKSQLSVEVSTDFLDISIFSFSKLKKLPLSIFSYDLKYASTVLDGQTNILGYIPNYKSSEISLKEGAILFFTRLWTFCGSLPTFFQSLDGEQARFFRYQMSKALLAVIDVILILKKSYHTSYKERVKRVASLSNDSEFEKYLPLFKWALQEKLSPSSEFMSESEVKELYEKTAYIYRYFMLKLLSKQKNKSFKLVEDYYSNYSKSVVISLKRIVYPFLRNGSRDFEKSYFLNLVQMDVLSHALKEGADVQRLYRARENLSKAGKKCDLDWNQIKKGVADLRVGINDE